MNDPGGVLLVDGTPGEQAALAGVATPVTASALDTAGDALVVVVGSAAGAPVALAQRAHRAAPHAGVAVVTTPAGDADVRRQLSYAPGVPLDVLVLGPGDDLAVAVATLRESAIDRRRHAEQVAALATRGQDAVAAPRPGLVGLGALLAHAPVGIVVCEPDGRLLSWNRCAESLLALDPASAGVPVDDVLPGAGRLLAPLGSDGPPAPVELATGDVEVEVSGVTSELDDGRPVALLLLVDVTTRRRAERARDRLAGHVQLLAEVSEILTRTLDPAQAVRLLARTLVPALGDWVGVRVATEAAGANVVAVHHRDSALADTADRVRELLVPARLTTPLGRRAASGEPVLLNGLSDAELREHIGDAELTRLLGRLGATHLLAVPLRGRADVLGVMVLATSSVTRPLTEADLAVALEVGRRAGVALDNARLYAQQRQLATELQRSLLTDPPQPDDAQIVVRYVAAAQQSQVGGDWYDAFLQPDGATVVVIGDVVGHDTRAAAAMGQLRGLLRGIAYTTSGDPAETLTRVDAAIEGLRLGTTASAVVARLAPSPDAGSVRLTWSNAGHPPPIVVRPDGGIDVLGEPFDGEADLLLGIDPTTSRRTAEVALPLGSTVLLYTDGLVERRGRSLDEGIAELTAALADASGRALDDLCDTALRRLLPDEPEDDVALVAVRVHAPGTAPATMVTP